MSGFMDFVGNQWLIDQYQRAADPKAKGKILIDLMDNLENDGMSPHDAFHHMKTVLNEDAHAEAALFFVKTTRKIQPV